MQKIEWNIKMHTHKIKITVPQTPVTSLTSQKPETGKTWNEANLRLTSLYGCIQLVLLFFHQAEYI